MDKREKILNSCLMLVCDHGFHGTTMATIAEKAKVAAGTIYRYFKNKDDLIHQLFEHIIKKVQNHVVLNLDSNSNFFERFAKLWESCFFYFSENLCDFVFIDQYISSPYLQITVDELHTQYFPELIEFFDSAIKEKIVKDLPLELILTISFDPALALAKKVSCGIIKMEDHFLEEAIKSCWKAITLDKI